MNAAIIYHKNCYDGMGAAWTVRKRLNQSPLPLSVSYHPLNWGDPFPSDIEPGTSVYIVDFAFPRAILEEKFKTNPLMVIDHHKTSEADLKGLMYAFFDMDRSGAGLAWDLLHQGKKRPRLIDYIEDRDLWRFQLYRSREVHAWLSSHPRDFERWDNLMEMFDRPTYQEDVMDQGVTILRFENQKVEEFAREATFEGWATYSDIPTVNVPYNYGSLVSEKLSQLYPHAPFVVYYFDRADGKTQYGIRGGLSKSVDVSKIAQEFGGGGHFSAAGFLRDMGGKWTKSR